MIRVANCDRRFALLPLCFLAVAALVTSGCNRTSGTATDKPAEGNSPAVKDSKADSTSADAKSADAKGGDAKADDALPTVSVATVTRGTATQTLPVTGTLAAIRNRQAALSSSVAGTVEALPVRLGQRVTQGQVVLHLATQTLEGQIEQARATIRQNEIQVQQAEVNLLQQQGQTQSTILQAQTAVSGAQATLLGARATLTGNEAALANARQSLSRTQALFKEGLVAQKDVEAAQLAVRAAQAQVATQRQAVAAQEEAVRGQRQAAVATQTGRFQNLAKQKDIAIARQQLAGARGALTTLETQRALYTLRAPLTGTVTAIAASVGETVDTATKVVTITDLSRLQLQIAVPSVSAQTVATGQTVTFATDAVPNRTFTATIRSIGRQIDAQNGTVTAVADVDNSGQRLKEGMFARVQIVLARHPNARLVPRAAVLFDAAASGTAPQTSDTALGNTTASVLAVAKDGTVHKVAVVTGWVSGDNVEIVSGKLQPGDKIATTGAYGLEDGAKVQIADASDKKEP